MTLHEQAKLFERALSYIDPLSLIFLGWLLGLLTAMGLIAIGIWKGEIVW
jgi:hypothetical protein